MKLKKALRNIKPGMLMRNSATGEIKTVNFNDEFTAHLIESTWEKNYLLEDNMDKYFIQLARNTRARKVYECFIND